MNTPKIFITVNEHVFEAVRIDPQPSDAVTSIKERFLIKQKTVLGETPFEVIIYDDRESMIMPISSFDTRRWFKKDKVVIDEIQNNL